MSLSFPGHDSMLLAPLHASERFDALLDAAEAELCAMSDDALCDAAMHARGRPWWEGRREFIASRVRDELSEVLATEDQQDDCERFLIAADGAVFFAALAAMRSQDEANAYRGMLIDDCVDSWSDVIADRRAG